MAKTRLVFPDGFWWGAASSGPQSEGWCDKENDNVMDHWFRMAPQDFFDGKGPDTASDFYHTYPSDLKMMKEAGMNSWRTSIQWSRLMEDPETGKVSKKAVKYYTDLIAQSKKNGLEPVINLHHFDLPYVLFEKYGGWQSKKVVDLFADFAAACFALFGDAVKYWVTFNEPMVIPEAGYLQGHHFPKLKHKGREAVQIMFNLNLASAKAIEAFRKSGKDGKIGIICNLTPSYPKSDDPADVQAARFADAFFNDSFLLPAVQGKFPEVLVDILKKDGVIWQADPAEMETIENNTVDFLGINYYQPKRVQSPNTHEPAEEWVPERYYREWKMPGARINPYRGWEIYPRAMYDIAKRMQKDFENVPWFISENGMGVEDESRFAREDGVIEDGYRIDFLEEHLAWLHKAIQEGSRCFGFHIWTPFDCWSWNNAYKNRYGLFSVDLETMQRTPKASAAWLKLVSEQNGFDYDPDRLKEPENRNLH